MGAALLLLASTAAAQEWTARPVRVAIDGDFAPYSFLDEAGHPRGYVIDYFQLLARRNGVRFSFVPFEGWEQLYDAAVRREVDVVATMVDRPERRSAFRFTRPYLFKRLVLVARESEAGNIDPGDLNGRRVALVRGYNVSQLLLERFPGIRPLWVSRTRAALSAVSRGEADAAATFHVAALWHHARGLSNLAVAGIVDARAGDESIAVRSDWPGLVPELERVMAQIPIEEEIELRRRWLAPAELGIDWGAVRRSAVSITVVLLLITLWSLHTWRQARLLRRERVRLTDTVAELETLRETLEQQIAARTRELERKATHDELTGLGNRSQLQRSLESAMNDARERSGTFALLYLDLDRFKYINDTLGHSVGDVLLTQVSARLREVIDDPESIARFGGDEFTIVLPGAGREEAARLAGKILEVLTHPFRVGDLKQLSLRASIGIALYGEHGTDTTTLLQHADSAMYQAKRNRRGWSFANERIVGETRRTANIEQMLLEAVRAVGRGQSPFELHYQPIVPLKGNRPSSYEALLRWPAAAERGMGPADFIPLAEEIGLIDNIGAWVLETAVAQAAAWRRTNHPFDRICVNISAMQLADDGFEERLERLLHECGCSTGCLALEITETALMFHPEETLERIRRLHHLGYEVAIDDFGTGFSSLSQLRSLPAHVVKIDRTFIAGLPESRPDRAIVQSIVPVAHALGARVVAEGVETAEQYRFLEKAGCDAVQGWFTGRPAPPARLEEGGLVTSPPPH